MPSIVENLDISNGRSFASTNKLIKQTYDNCGNHKSWKRRIISHRFGVLLNNTRLTVDDLLKLPQLSNTSIIGDKIINSCKDKIMGILHTMINNKSDHNNIIHFCEQNPSINIAIGIDKYTNIPFIFLRLEPWDITSDGYVRHKWPMKIRYSHSREYIVVIQFLRVNNKKQVCSVLYSYDTQDNHSYIEMYSFGIIKIQPYQKLILFDFIENIIKYGQGKYYNTLWDLADTRSYSASVCNPFPARVCRLLNWITFGYCFIIGVVLLLILALRPMHEQSREL